MINLLYPIIIFLNYFNFNAFRPSFDIELWEIFNFSNYLKEFIYFID